jgi:hypothetical protein
VVERVHGENLIGGAGATALIAVKHFYSRDNFTLFDGQC